MGREDVVGVRDQQQAVMIAVTRQSETANDGSVKSLQESMRDDSSCHVDGPGGDQPKQADITVNTWSDAIAKQSQGGREQKEPLHADDGNLSQDGQGGTAELNNFG